MRKRAEELAAQYKATCDRGGKCMRRGRCKSFCEDAFIDFEQYGRECLEAAANCADECAFGEYDNDVAVGGIHAAIAIRQMKLP